MMHLCRIHVAKLLVLFAFVAFEVAVIIVRVA